MSIIRANAIQTVAGKPIVNSTGSILQVVNVTGNFNHSTTSSTLQPTSLAATITPSSTSNKILINFAGFVATNASGSHVTWSIYRGATNLVPSAPPALYMGNFYSTNAGTFEGQASMVWLDSPATTSATTYTIYFASYNNSTTVIFGGGRQSSIALMEVSA